MRYLKTFEKFEYSSLSREVKDIIQNIINDYKKIAEDRLNSYAGQVDGLGNSYAGLEGEVEKDGDNIVFKVKWGIKYDSNLTKNTLTKIIINSKTLEKTSEEIKSDI